jgi:hypothetical protein
LLPLAHLSLLKLILDIHISMIIIPAIFGILTDQLLLCHTLILQGAAVRKYLAVFGADSPLMLRISLFLKFPRSLVLLIDFLKVIVQRFLKTAFSWFGHQSSRRSDLEVAMVGNVLIL